ncbi:MAG: acyl-CoA thioesterase [Syntrophales bacterium]|jgi:acyl-CoA hydrolase|nr:acyl-CoA thioesterase [Syntrophales bacterium]MCK9392353.1 acyl-CoA thioesterase [Syntrophales bacterium]
MIEETKISRIIKSEDLNHHGTLFAGRMSEWLVEGCLIAAIKLLGRPEDIVCVRIHGMDFVRPATKGDIVELKTRVALLGKKSITAYGKVFVNENRIPSVTGMTTFVTVDKSGKPYAHGMSLSEEYIRENEEIYKMAIKAKNQR